MREPTASAAYASTSPEVAVMATCIEALDEAGDHLGALLRGQPMRERLGKVKTGCGRVSRPLHGSVIGGARRAECAGPVEARLGGLLCSEPEWRRWESNPLSRTFEGCAANLPPPLRLTCAESYVEPAGAPQASRPNSLSR